MTDFITIDGKFYKKHQLHLIQNKDMKAERFYPTILQHSFMFDEPGVLGYYDCNIRTPTIEMKLYLTSDDSPKIHDTVLDVRSGVPIRIEHSQILESVKLFFDMKLILGSSDEQLIEGERFGKEMPFPKFSKEYIELFIGESNKGNQPLEVLVEYERWKGYSVNGNLDVSYPDHCCVKTDENHQLILRPVEDTKLVKTWGTIIDSLALPFTQGCDEIIKDLIKELEANYELPKEIEK